MRPAAGLGDRFNHVFVGEWGPPPPPGAHCILRAKAEGEATCVRAVEAGMVLVNLTVLFTLDTQ